MTTEFHVSLAVNGARLDPDTLTKRLGIEPSRSFAVGESIQPAWKHRAQWAWRSRVGDDPDAPAIEAVELFEPKLEVLRAVAAQGAEISFSVSGQPGGDVVMTAAEADRRRIHSGSEAQFTPIFDGDRFGPWLNPRIMAFLGAVPCAFGADIDVDIDDVSGGPGARTPAE